MARYHAGAHTAGTARRNGRSEWQLNYQSIRTRDFATEHTWSKQQAQEWAREHERQKQQAWKARQAELRPNWFVRMLTALCGDPLDR